MRLFEVLCILFIFCVSCVNPTLVVLNSQNYEDIISVATYAKHNDYSFVFALTPNQSVFISKYYTSDPNEPIIYVESEKPVLANMKALLQTSGVKNISTYTTQNVPFWVADQSDNSQAIIVGKTYGQDALAVSSYSALVGAPIFFIDPSKDSSEIISKISSKGYSQIIIYGAISEQIDSSQLELLPPRKVINTGNRYSNNLEITKEFLKIRKSEQAIFVSGHTFEKSMVDANYPLILVGRSDIPTTISDFVNENSLKTGVVFSGDGDIVDGVNRIRIQNPQMTFFVKFGEGYRGSSEPMPLMVVALPSPSLSIEVLNLSYNIPSKLFELRIKNPSDFVVLSAGASVPDVGSAQSSQIHLNPQSTTTLSIPLDASQSISNGVIPSVSITLSYGEDTALMDNVDTVEFTNVSTSFYNDSSSVRLESIFYSSDEKSFLVNFDGRGWVVGTLGFNINNRAVVLQIPITKISGPTQVKIKHLLSSDEEKFINGISSNYFLRYGEKEDILLKELRGDNKIQITQTTDQSGKKSDGDSKFSIFELLSSPITIIIVLLAIILVFASRFLRGSSDSFE